MYKVSVHDILLTPLKNIPTQGGDVLHVMKKSDSGFAGFGEAYCSWVEQGAVKAWKRHLSMTINLVVPVGCVSFVFVDEKKNQREEMIGEQCYQRITVPPGLWFGFQGISSPSSLIINLANIPHDPDEVERKEMENFNFDWLRKR